MMDLICYCFDYTHEDIEQDVMKNGRSTIMEKIMAEKSRSNTLIWTDSVIATFLITEK